MDPQDDRAAFAAVHEVLRGRRLPLDHAGSKVLSFILDDPRGCDATITSQRFEIRFGWNPARHRYRLSVAPVVVSELLVFAGIRDAAMHARARIGPASIAPKGEFIPWVFTERLLWIDSTEEAVTIFVRDCASGLALDRVPAPFPEPDRAARFVELEPPLPCPHCAELDSRYRELSDGSLVCQACGRSFPSP